jgi:Sodium/hydrogen exchanger family
MPSMEIETGFILLFVAATAVALAVRRVGMPYTVALVLAGLILGAVQVFPAPALTKTLLFSVFLPGLIFEAAFHIDSREFRSRLARCAANGVGPESAGVLSGSRSGDFDDLRCRAVVHPGSGYEHVRSVTLARYRRWRRSSMARSLATVSIACWPISMRASWSWPSQSANEGPGPTGRRAAYRGKMEGRDPRASAYGPVNIQHASAADFTACKPEFQECCQPRARMRVNYYGYSQNEESRHDNR